MGMSDPLWFYSCELFTLMRIRSYIRLRMILETLCKSGATSKKWGASRNYKETEHFRRGRQKEVAKIVHSRLASGLLRISWALLPSDCARKFCKKLSISVGSLKKKLRRLSSVGSIIP